MRLQRLGRKLLLVLLGLIGCVLLILALLPYVVSLDRVKATMIARLEAVLQRKVEVGAVRLQILSGLGVALEDVTVYNPPGWEQPHVFKAATLSARLAWRPLLQRRLEISRVVLRDGAIVIERDAQGRLNLPEAAGSAPASEAAPVPGGQALPNRPETPPGPAPLARLRLADVTLQNMSIAFVDRRVVPGQTVVTAANEVQLQLRDVAPGRPIALDLTATFLTSGRRNVHIRGNIGPMPESQTVDGLPVDLQVQAADVQLEQLTPYLSRAIPLRRGRVDGELTLQGGLSAQLRLGGQLSLADVVLREGTLSKDSNTLPTLTSTQDVVIDLAGARIDLSRVEINAAGLQATLTGSVQHFTTTPHLDLQIATDPFDPAALLTHFPMLVKGLPAPTEVRGTVQLQATLKGAPDDLRSEAQIGLQGIRLSSGSFNGGATAGGGVLVETDRAEARLEAQLLRSEPPRLQVDVRAQRLAFDRQRPRASAPGPAPAPASAPQPGPTKSTAPAPPPARSVHLQGKLQVAEGRVQHLNVQQLSADFNLAQGVLNATHQMRLYGGTSRGTTQIDLKPAQPAYRHEGRIAGLQLAPALADLTPAQQHVLGVLDTDMRLSGQGFAWEVMQQTLSGEGHVKISEARFRQFDLLPQLMALLQNVGGLVGLTLSSDVGQGPWHSVEGDWRLQHGKFLTERLRLRQEGAEALLSGSVGLDQRLDYTGTLFLPAKVSGRRGVAKILRQDDAGRLQIPFTVQGTLHAPRISVDEKALIGQAQEELLDSVRKRLGDRVDEFFGRPSAPDQPGQEPGQTGPQTGERRRRPDWPEKILRDLFRR